MNRAILYPLTAAVVIFTLAAVLLVSAMRGSGTADQYPLNKACYSITSRDGAVYKSWFPPVPAADGPGIYTFNNDHTWGYVFGPNAMIADRDCLRERYPGDTMVPPIEGSDD